MSSGTDYAVWLELYDTKDGVVERAIATRGFDKTHTLGDIGFDSKKLVKKALQKSENVAPQLMEKFLQDTQVAGREKLKQICAEAEKYCKAVMAANEAKKISWFYPPI